MNEPTSAMGIIKIETRSIDHSRQLKLQLKTKRETMSAYQLVEDNQNNCEEVISDLVKSPPRQRHISAEESQDDTENREDVELRRQREEDESLALVRHLMAEEAMASYEQSYGLMRQSAENLSVEDYEALQAALEDDEHEQVAELEDDEGNLSYETMLQLGERMGDVKTERWAMRAQKEIEKIPSFRFKSSGKTIDSALDDSECKCLVCQCDYEEGDLKRRLPCSHCFHAECVDQWLMEKDICPYCRQSIVE
jgi:hypothetical protein